MCGRRSRRVAATRVTISVHLSADSSSYGSRSLLGVRVSLRVFVVSLALLAGCASADPPAKGADRAVCKEFGQVLKTLRTQPAIDQTAAFVVGQLSRVVSAAKSASPRLRADVVALANTFTSPQTAQRGPAALQIVAGDCDSEFPNGP